MNNDSISNNSLTDWERLETMADTDIDLSDCPEVTPEMFAKAVVRQGGIAKKPNKEQGPAGAFELAQ